MGPIDQVCAYLGYLMGCACVLIGAFSNRERPKSWEMAKVFFLMVITLCIIGMTFKD